MHLPSPFNPGSPNALATSHLFIIVLWLTAAYVQDVLGDKSLEKFREGKR
jgi:hypothetical protein